jgi:hypothetical protein
VYAGHICVAAGKCSRDSSAVIGLLAATGGGYISDFLRDVIERLRRQEGAPRSEAELQAALERALLASLEGQNERAAALRADVAVLLERVRDGNGAGGGLC